MFSCIFCRVVSGELPSYKLYEDDRVIAFLDIFPAVKGHILVVPKTHAENMFASDPEDIKATMKVVLDLAPKLEKALGADGINITTNKGEVAGQSVFHTHVHILPRFKDDGKSLWGPMDSKPDLAELYEELKQNL